MDGIKYLFDSFMLLFDHDFTIYGFTISFFDIFIFGVIVSIASFAIGRLFGGDWWEISYLYQ